MRLKGLITFLIICLLQNVSFAQDNFTEPSKKEGELNIVHDYRLNYLIDKHIEINKEKCPKNMTYGYKVELISFFGPGAQEKAENYFARFKAIYPDLPIEIDYDDPPNFRVRVGNARTRLEAERIRKDISQYFNSHVVRDYIETSFVNCQEYDLHSKN